MVRSFFRRGVVASELKPQPFTENYQAVCWDFDLSWNSSLRTLETTAISITSAGSIASGFLKAVLSTVASPLLLDIVINYDMSRVRRYMPSYIRAGWISETQQVAEALVHRERFKVFSEMYMVRDFRLVLCADVPDQSAEDATRALEAIVRAERKNGGLQCEPVIISEMRSPRVRSFNDQVGAANREFLVLCAL